jgi:3-deoxy-D-manno-octulosonate 8-phosphate phosphatase (KDO 8-P phosphatase)
MPTIHPHPTPAIAFEPALIERAKAIKMVFFDVDGVMTDGGLYIGESGEVVKRFHSLDGHGIKLLQRAGVVVGVITGRDSAALRTRLAALGIAHVRYGTEEKRTAAQEMLTSLGLNWSQAAAMGDDWPDAPVLARVALACCPATAHAQVKALAHFVPTAPAGHGAVRELCDLILMAQGHYDSLWHQALA